MRISLHTETTTVDLALDPAARPGPTVGDLFRAADLAPPQTPVRLAGRELELDAPLSTVALVPGATITTGRDRAPDLDTGHGETSARGAPTTLAVTAGLDAGALFVLEPGAHTIGRGGDNRIDLSSPTVSRRHATVHVGPVAAGPIRITDTSSTNGVRRPRGFAPAAVELAAGEPFRLGAVELATVVTADPRPLPVLATPAEPPPSDPVVRFNRPPRVATGAPGPALAAPPAPRSRGGTTPFSWAAFGAPLVIGLVMARLVSPALALFAILSPVLLVMTWLEQRRRRRREERRGHHAYTGALATFDASVAAAAGDEVARRHAAHPDLAQLVRRARAGDPRLWERRRLHDDFLQVQVGSGARTWTPQLEHPVGAIAPAVDSILEEHGLLPFVPIVVDASGGHIIGIVGPAAVTNALARALLIQAAVLHGPADLSIGGVAGAATAATWAFLSWFPHALDPEDPSAPLIAPAGAADRTARRIAAGVTAATGSTGRGGRAIRVGNADRPRTWLTIADNRHGDLDHDVLQHVLPTDPGDARAALVLARDRRELPAGCTAVIECTGPDGQADVTFPRDGTTIADVLVAGASATTAMAVGRGLARFTDPELPDSRRPLPTLVTWADLGPTHPAPSSEGPAYQGMTLRCTIGIGVDSPVTIDLVRDGPHALIGGTTGSGKSELLRALIASLTHAHDPDEVNLVLIDYKGGSAFDACARLPHTVGLVTDLDDGLAARALRSLEAEVRHREQRLRDVGAADLVAYAAQRRDGSLDPLPRLVVVIDEFATLATEVPAFLDALVSVAQRGRSLGIHLILATQRPHGTISDAIRTNTNIRVALRMLDAADSVDVLGDPAAAHLARQRPGRGYLRLGPDELVAFQAPLLSVPAGALGMGGAESGDGPAIGGVAGVQRLDQFGRPVLLPPAAVELGGATMLDRVVDEAAHAWAARARTAPRPPWLPPLPAHLDLDEIDDRVGLPSRDDLRCPDDMSRDDRSRDDLPSQDDLPARPELGSRHDLAARHEGLGRNGARAAEPCGVLAPITIGLADDPDRQRQRPWAWSPRRGALLVCGMPGSGTTTALLSVGAALARRHPPEDLHLYVIDFDHGGAAALGVLPHCGAVIGSDESARQHRLLRHLDDELRRRRGGDASGAPSIVVLIDGFAALRAAHDDLAGLRVLDQVARLGLDGPAFGLHLVITAERPQALPPALTAATLERLVLRLADPYDYGLCGLRTAPLAPPRPGRARSTDSIEVQLAITTPAMIAAIAAGPTGVAARATDATSTDPASTDGGAGPTTDPSATNRRPGWAPAIGELPVTVDLADLAAADLSGPVWSVPIGRGDLDLTDRAIELHHGECLLIAGPPRSGRSTTLAVIAAQARRAGADAVTLGASGDGEAAATAMAMLAARLHQPARVPLLVLADDAEAIDDPDGVLDQLVRHSPGHVRVIVAGLSDRLRRAYGHWTHNVRGHTPGLALRADLDADTELWGVARVRLPPLPWCAGRALLLTDAGSEVIQVARP